MELAAARGFGAPIGQIDDLAMGLAGNRRMRRIDKARETFGEPMIAPRLPKVAVHSLLHDSPMAIIAHDKSVQIEVEPVLHRRTVDLGDEPARRGECRSIKADPRANALELIRCPPRVGSAAAAHVDSKLARERRETAFQCADNARRDAGGMPVHAHDGAERLEPERMRQAAL